MSKRFICTLLALASLAALPGASAGEDVPSRTAVVAIDIDPPCLNSALDTCNLAVAYWVMKTTLAGAYRVRPDFSFEPVLVDRVEVETDPFALTYSIKPEAVWSDGTEVTADDFIFTLETLRDPANTTSAWRSTYERVSSAERIDAKTFRLLFERPMPNWQSLFSFVLPKHVLDGYDFDEVWRAGIDDPATGTPIGSGPFLLTSRTPGASLTVTPNPRWWGGGGPFLDSIVFQVVQSPAAQLQGVRDGVLDLVFPQPQLGIADVRGAEGVVVEWATGATIEHIDFNVTSTTMPLLQESWFRRAVAFALDREGAAAAAYGSLIPDYPARQSLSYDPVQAEYEPSFGAYSFDPDAVEEIMLGQGCVTDPDGIWSCGGVRASVKLATVVAGNEPRAQVQQFLIARARAAGIELVADNDSGSVFFGTRLPARQYELAFFAWVDQIGRSLLPFYGCAGAQNFLGYCSAAVDELLLQADNANDLSTRGELLGDAYDLIAADMPTIPLLARPVFLVRRDRLRGPQMNPGGIATWNVEEWRLGTDEMPPSVDLVVAPATGVVPLDTSATITASDPDEDPLTFTLEFGDGSPVETGSLPVDPLAHRYTRAGSFIVRLAVSDGQRTTIRTQTVVVGLAEPLKAIAGDDLVAVVDTPVTFDGSASRPLVGIEGYTWDFGDGTPQLSGVRVSHTYTSTGKKTVTLTARSGATTSSDTLTVDVIPVPAQPGLAITVTDANSSPLPGADVLVMDGDGKRFTAVTGSSGVARLLGLPDGGYTAYAWREGYRPGTVAATQTDGTGAATVALEQGEIAQTSLTAERLTYDEIVAAGIDPNAPGNQNVFQFEISLAVGSSDVVFSGYTTENGFVNPSYVGGGGGGWSGGYAGPCTLVDGYTACPTLSYANDQPTILWLVIPGKARWLKEFFDVRLIVTNLASEAFTFENGEATLGQLPRGLSLAPTATAQALTQAMPTIPGGQSRDVSWIVRGDDEGVYTLTAQYRGTLEPFGKSIFLSASTQPDALRVWGSSAVEMIIDADDAVNRGYPFRVRVGLKNVSDTPVYNPEVELLEDGRLNYIYQPRERLAQRAAVVQPGETFWTDYYRLVPEITGALDLVQSFVKKTAGDVDSEAIIVSHPAVPIADVPEATALLASDGIRVRWDAVPGATAYELYVTETRDTPFGGTSIVRLPANTLSALIPNLRSGFVAVSSIINGVNTMIHPLLEPAEQLAALDVAILDAPAKLYRTADGYAPNPFTITARLSNTSDETLPEVTATLDIPEGLTVTGSPVLEIGTLKPGASREIEWQVTAANSSERKTLSYSVIAETPIAKSATARSQITIPARPLACAGYDAALIGVRGSGDPDTTESDGEAVRPGRIAVAIANYLQKNGLNLYDNDNYRADHVIGLQYPAVGLLSAVLSGGAGYGVSVSTGKNNLLAEINTLRSTCGPDLPILLAGFSQGAHVIQSALDELDDRANSGDATWESIAGVSLIASPRFDPDDVGARGTFPASAPKFGLLGQQKARSRFESITRTYCLKDDPICQAPADKVAKCLLLRRGPDGVLTCLVAAIKPLLDIHSNGYIPNKGVSEWVIGPKNWLMQDAAELLRWATRKREGLTTSPRPIGSLQAYRDFLNPLNTRVSAGGIYARGAPTTLYKWDFDSNGTIDTTTTSPFVVHAYGVGITLRGFDTITTTVRIQHIDGTQTTRSICIRRAPFGSATC